MSTPTEIPTPRTDAQVARNLPHARFRVNIDFARQLERELAAVTKERDILKRAREINLDSINLVVKERDDARRACAKAEEDAGFNKEAYSDFLGVSQELAASHAQIHSHRTALERILQDCIEDLEQWEKYPEHRSAIIGSIAAHRDIALQELITPPPPVVPSGTARLAAWYAHYCDGEWEHSNGVKIETYDNPGWGVVIDIEDTDCRLMEGKQAIHDPSGDAEYEWEVRKGKFHGFTSNPAGLDTLLGHMADALRLSQFIDQYSAAQAQIATLVKEKHAMEAAHEKLLLSARWLKKPCEKCNGEKWRPNGHVCQHCQGRGHEMIPPPVVDREDAERLAEALGEVLSTMDLSDPSADAAYDRAKPALDAYRAKYPKEETK